VQGVALNDIADPFLGDLNKMRNDVVHHYGVATRENTGRCEKLRWFGIGKPIHVMPEHVAEFMGYLGRVHSMDGIGGDEPWEIKTSV
jgi:hypothetical protein